MVVKRRRETSVFFHHAAALDVPGMFLGVGHLVQTAADHRLRLFAFGHRDRLETMVALGHVDVATHEVDEVGSLQEHLRHPSVVAAVGGQMAIRTSLRFALANAVREVWIESLPAQPLGGSRLLLRVEPFALRAPRGNQHRAGGAHRNNPAFFRRAVAAQHENVVTQHLIVVRGEVPRRGLALAVQRRAISIGFHRKVAAKATGHPRGVAGVAGHLVVGMRERAVRRRSIAPVRSVALDRLRQPSLFVVFGVPRRDRIHHLRNRPRGVGFNHRALHQLVADPLKTPRPERRSQDRQIMRRAGRRRIRHLQPGPLAKASVAVRAIDLDRRPRLAVEHAVAVNVLLEMAINAMHALFEVNVF